MNKRSVLFSVFMILALMTGLVFQVTPASAATAGAIVTSIDRGLVYLDSVQETDGRWEGGSYDMGVTCAALTKFQDRAYELGFDSPFDADYVYHTTVTDAYTYIFNHVARQTLAVQPAGNPDTNGNGYGLYFGTPDAMGIPMTGDAVYETALCMMAIVSSRTPDRLNSNGFDYDGDATADTFKEVLQENVDQLAWAQNEAGSGRGGWRYGFNTGDSDGSVSGFATLGLAYAEGWGVTIPAFVKTELNVWSNYIQSADGGAGYTGPGSSNSYRTGHLITQFVFLGDDPMPAPGSLNRMDKALRYLEGRFNAPFNIDGFTYLSTWSQMKGLAYAGIDNLNLNGAVGDTRDDLWFNQEPSVGDDLATFIVNNQAANGSWPASVYEGNSVAMSTAFALLILEKSAPSSSPTITPNGGPIDGGTSVVINGNGFNDTTTVTFGGIAADCTEDSETQLTCTTPAHAKGAVDVVTTTGTVVKTTANGFTYYDVPYFTEDEGDDIVPDTGPTAGGTTVVLTGINFLGVSSVTFGGTAAACSADSDTQITCVTPPHAAAPVDVVVTTPGGAATSTNGFRYVPAPTLDGAGGGLDPAIGSTLGGTLVTITGTDLDTVSSVTFGGTTTPAPCTVLSSTQITCTTPAHTAGLVNVVITTAGGSVTAVNGFEYVPMVLSTRTPSIGSALGGTHVAITGMGFLGSAGGVFKFGGNTASCTIVSDVLANCITPSGLVGPKDVTFSVGGATITKEDWFTYVYPPSFDWNEAISPNTGSALGGTTVHLYGLHLAGIAPTGAVFTFGGLPAVCTVDPDGTHATCTTPKHVPGKVDVVVTTTGGTATLRGGFTYVTPTFIGPNQWSTGFSEANGWTVQNSIRLVGDVDDNGTDDAIGFGPNGVYVALSNGVDGFDAPEQWSTEFGLAGGWTMLNFARTVGDVDDDGCDDLVGFGQDGVYVALSNCGDGFEAASKMSTDFGLDHGWTVQSYVRTVGDINGDGHADLVGFGYDGVYVARATGHGTGFEAITPAPWTTDFDSILHGWNVQTYVRTVGDVNDDGKDDLIGFGYDGVYVAITNGTGTDFGAVSQWITTNFDLLHGWNVQDYVRTVGDVFGDRMVDVVGFGNDGTYVAMSTGTAFGSTERWSTVFDLSHGWTVQNSARMTGDVNGDGNDDLVGFGPYGVYVAIAQ